MDNTQRANRLLRKKDDEQGGTLLSTLGIPWQVRGLGESLASWLNQRERGDGRTGVVDFLQHLQRLQPHNRFQPLHATLEERRADVERFNVRLKELAAWPRLSAIGPSFFITKAKGAIPSSNFTFEWRPSLSPEREKCFAVLRLAEAGRLDRLLRCEGCNRWFYGRRVNQICCNSSCERLRWSSPQKKRERARYMRNYRQTSI
jgi:hypothetical protein